MDMNKLTQKSREAIAKAQSFAVQYGSAQVDQIHLLYALADQEEERFTQVKKLSEYIVKYEALMRDV